MSDQEIKINLCYYDPENPNSNLDAYDDEDRPKPRTEGCCCENCFYGRDKLAMQLIEAKRERDEAREAFVIATDQMVIAQGKVRESNTERDEAREALMKIEDLFIDGSIQSKLMGQIFAHTNKSWA